MTNKQRIEIRMSKIREELSTLSGKESLDETETKRLPEAETEYRQAETQLRAAIIAEPEEQKKEGPKAPDSEQREKAELRSKARAGDWITAAITGRTVSGASAEFAASVDVNEGIPLALFETEKREQVETRDTTPAPTTTPIQTSQTDRPGHLRKVGGRFVGHFAMPVVATRTSQLPQADDRTDGWNRCEGRGGTQHGGRVQRRIAGPRNASAGEFTVRVQDIALFPQMENDLRQGIVFGDGQPA